MAILRLNTWRRRPIGVAALFVVCIVLFASLLAPLLAKSPNEGIASERLQPPSREHWLGTDNFGRDVLSRVIYGARISLLIGFAVMLLSSLLGTAVGLVSGYYRKLDNLLMRLLDGLLAFPPILLGIAVVAALGASLVNEIIALSAVYFPRTARIVRAATLQIREVTFVEAAISAGAGDFLIIRRHILRNAITPLIVQATFVFAEAVLADASLSFLGLGVPPPTPTWGNMLSEARVFIVSAPWFFVFPGLAIVVTVLALNLLGDTLRDLFDPRSRHRVV